MYFEIFSLANDFVIPNPFQVNPVVLRCVDMRLRFTTFKYFAPFQICLPILKVV